MGQNRMMDKNGESENTAQAIHRSVSIFCIVLENR
jgi:hypothetical protein